MSHTNLKDMAAGLPDAWKSALVGRFGGARLKVLRMDGSAYPEESHSYPEGLLVLDGRMELVVNGEGVTVRAGELFVVPAGMAHSVAPGSAGTLVIIEAGE